MYTFFHKIRTRETHWFLLKTTDSISYVLIIIDIYFFLALYTVKVRKRLEFIICKQLFLLNSWTVKNT